MIETPPNNERKQQLVNLTEDIKKWFGLTDGDIGELLGRGRQYLWYLRNKGMQRSAQSDEQLEQEIRTLQTFINQCDSGQRKPRSLPLDQSVLREIITELSRGGRIDGKRIAHGMGISAGNLHNLLDSPTTKRIRYSYVEALEAIGAKIRTQGIDTHEEIYEVLGNGAEKARAYRACIEKRAQWEFPEVFFSIPYKDAKHKIQELIKYGYEHHTCNEHASYMQCKSPIIIDFASQYMARMLERTRGSVPAAAREAGISKEGCYNLLEDAHIPWLTFDPAQEDTSLDANPSAHRPRNGIFIRIAELTAHRQSASNSRHGNAERTQYFQQI